MTTDSVDWSKALGGLYTTVRGLEQDREDLKLELDQIKTDNIRTIQQADNFSSQTFQQQMLGASQNGVATIKGWDDALKRGELDPKQYKQNMNNLMENWKMLGNSVKGFDARNAEIQKQIQDGNASLLSVEAAEYFARAADLKNLQVFIDPATGTISTGRLDSKTGQVIPDTIESSKTIADPSNAVFNKVDVDAEVNKSVKLFGDVVQEDGITTVTDATKNPRFAAKLADLTGALTSNDRMTASILVDNTGEGYSPYFSQQDREAKIMSMVNKENQIRRYQGEAELSGEALDSFIKESSDKLIPMQKDSSGVYQPVLTEKQRIRARQVIEDAVYAQLDFKKTQDEPTRPTSTSDNTPKEDKPEYYAFASQVYNAWQNGDVDRLNTLSAGKFIFQKLGKGTYRVISSDGKTVRGVYNYINDAGPFFGSNQASWVKQMKKARNAQGTQPATSGMTEQEFNAKWAKLKTGQTLKGPDGKIWKKK